MEGIGLVLEGGGMRGVFTAGVLDFFMDNSIYIPYVIGVSAGACHATSYISNQRGRNKIVTIDYINHPRYISYKNIIKEKSLFGMDLIFDEIPNELVPFNFKRFYHSEQKFIIGTTNYETGEAVYFDKDDNIDILRIVRASSSIPLISPTVEIGDSRYLDGGIADPIPIKKSIADGNDKNIIVLTRNRGYRKTPTKFREIITKKYSGYPGLLEAILNRYKVYNETLDFIKKLEKEGKAIVIHPINPLKVDKMEKDKNKLEELYKEGYENAKKVYDKIMDWVESDYNSNVV